MDCTADEVAALRFATHRLSTAALSDPVDVVRQLMCVQGQDGPLARFSIGLRMAGGDHDVRAALDRGRLIRTHILRPTWHIVAAEDLRWILALTSPKVETGLAGRHRRLGVDHDTIDWVHHELAGLLADRRFLSAPEIGDALAYAGLAVPNETVRHLLLVAEVRGLICSGPLRGSTHTYGLVDDLIPPAPTVDRGESIRRFVQRFFNGRGPASEQDLRRWTTLTVAEIRVALADLADELEVMTCDETKLWYDPSVTVAEPPRRRAFLLPTFDEAHLSYKSVPLKRIAGHPRGEEPHVFAEAGGGVAIVDGRDAGWWKRTVRGSRSMTVRLALASGLDVEQRDLLAAEASALAAFFARVAEVDFVQP